MSKYKCKQTGHIIEVTHYNHFHVNRLTGILINNAATYMYKSGPQKGMRYVSSLDYLKVKFERMGN